MQQLDNEKNWYAFKIFFGKGKPIKTYFVSKEIEHIYDVKQEYWDKNIKKDHKLYVSIKGLCAVTTGYIPKAFLQKIE